MTMTMRSSADDMWMTYVPSDDVWTMYMPADDIPTCGQRSGQHMSSGSRNLQ